MYALVKYVMRVIYVHKSLFPWQLLFVFKYAEQSRLVIKIKYFYF